MNRFQYHPFWRVTRWGWLWPLGGRSSDEFHNRSVWVVVPMVGSFVVFTGRIDRSVEHLFGWGPDGLYGTAVDGCPMCDTIATDYLDDLAAR